jgi:hypothetical protein
VDRTLALRTPQQLVFFAVHHPVIDRFAFSKYSPAVYWKVTRRHFSALAADVSRAHQFES